MPYTIKNSAGKIIKNGKTRNAFATKREAQYLANAIRQASPRLKIRVIKLINKRRSR